MTPAPGARRSDRPSAHGHTMGCEDVFTRIGMRRAHCAAVGLGADNVDRHVR